MSDFSATELGWYIHLLLREAESVKKTESRLDYLNRAEAKIVELLALELAVREKLVPREVSPEEDLSYDDFVEIIRSASNVDLHNIANSTSYIDITTSIDLRLRSLSEKQLRSLIERLYRILELVVLKLRTTSSRILVKLATSAEGQEDLFTAPVGKSSEKTSTDTSPSSAAPLQPADEVWQHYQTAFGYERRKLSPDRKRAIVKALKEFGYSVEDLKTALTQAAGDAWWRGKHPNNNTPYDDVTQLLRHPKNIDRWIEDSAQGIRRGSMHDLAKSDRSMSVEEF